ncbi:amidohydrolase [Pseudoalteromonas sp. MMG024]|uniref:amidohydrolase n=1 Tax=Pseudoalteromonas sp. MMG024 TaxID=2909980 RepID=UPI001F3BDBFB|nr:amidohydrolase [Pseudoalteromonas sp. MMG024]MCF6457829.1 amidohydrolase [Pseudoalteromonas sp. MMG024]
MKRKTVMTSNIIAIAAALSGCGGVSESPNQASTGADLVVNNATIYTVNNASPLAQSMAIKNGKIIYVGDNESVNEFIGDNTEIKDLAGNLVLPGLHDVHIHPLESASEATHFTLPEYAYINEYQAVIENASIQHSDAKWLIGYGHNIDGLLELTQSPRAAIDQVVNDRPVIIMEQTSHSMWVNSKALSIANITQQSRDPIGGVFGRDESDVLNGILYDNAGNLVMDLAMQSQGDEATENYFGFLEYTQPELLKHGVTSISDARVYWQRGQLDTWLKLANDDALKMRVSLGLWAYPEASDESQLAKLKSLYQASQDSLLKVDQVKVYMDGILVNTTAALKAPYEYSWLALDGDKGLNYFTQARLAKYIEVLEPIGFDFNIHGIGDRGIHEALNAIEAGSKGIGRHRITHLEVVDSLDLPRFKELSVIADAQVAGEFTEPHHWPEMTPLLGHQRSDRLVPIASLVEQGAMLTLSSDWNVSTLNPFVGIAHAVSRAPEAISIEQAIEAYTINAAYAMRQEDRVGSLVAGKEADFIVLDRNILTLDAAQIKQTRVLQSYVQGEVVFTAK